MATIEKKYARMATLIKYGADINFKDPLGRTALFYAVTNIDHQAIGILINSDADINAKDIYNKSLLQIALENYDINTISFLVSRQADINEALFRIAESGEAQLMKLLLRPTADINICDSNGETPLEVAIKYNNLDIKDLLLTHNAKNSALANLTHQKENSRKRTLFAAETEGEEASKRQFLQINR